VPSLVENKVKQNKLKRFRRMRHLLMYFKPTREEVVGDLFPKEMNQKTFLRMTIR
jgi:hypothetical protein